MPKEKFVPHVVLVLGTHVPSIATQLESVLEQEKPSKLMIELLGSRQTLAGNLREWRKNENVPVEHPALEYGRRLHLLAKRKGVAFDFLEKLPEADFRETMRHYRTVSQYNEEVQNALAEGNLRRAIDLHIRGITHVLSANTIREPNWINGLVNAAKASARPVMALAGAGHVSLVKELSKRGVKVTLYTHRFNAPGTEAVIGNHYRKLTRGMVLKMMFRDHLFEHLLQRYNLTAEELPVIVASLPDNKKLRSFTSPEIDGFFQGLGISSPVRQRANLEALLERKGIKLPTTDEMREIRKTARLPPFRKVKVFEARQVH